MRRPAPRLASLGVAALTAWACAVEVAGDLPPGAKGSGAAGSTGGVSSGAGTTSAGGSPSSGGTSGSSAGGVGSGSGGAASGGSSGTGTGGVAGTGATGGGPAGSGATGNGAGAANGGAAGHESGGAGEAGSGGAPPVVVVPSCSDAGGAPGEASGGAAGAAGSSGGGSVPSSPDTGLRVQYVRASANTSDAEINAKFKIANDRASPVALSTLKLRYYYRKDSVKNQEAVSYDFDAASDATTAALPVKEGADHYLEITFTGSAPDVAAGAASPEFTYTVHPTGHDPPYDESDDYSYGAHATLQDWDKVTLYEDDTLVWGIEPYDDVAVRGVQLEYRVPPGTPASLSDVPWQVRLTNLDPDAVPLSELELRYYFDDDTDGDAVVAGAIYDKSITGGYSGSQYSYPPASVGSGTHSCGDHRFVSVTFSEGQLLWDDQLFLSGAFHLQNYPAMSQSNDWSCDQTQLAQSTTDWVVWERIVVLRNGSPIWGHAP